MLMPDSCYHAGPNGLFDLLYKRETCDTITIFVHFLFSIVYDHLTILTNNYHAGPKDMLMPDSCYSYAGPNGLFDLLI